MSYCNCESSVCDHKTACMREADSAKQIMYVGRVCAKCWDSCPEEYRQIQLWFYVPDYTYVRGLLETTYARFGVCEHAAEPGRVRGCPNDADVTVRGTKNDVERFTQWLRDSLIQGLQIEGKTP